MSWTEERVEKLKELWAEGMTASQIAKELSGVSRNAVIGKAHRLGLSHRASASKPAVNEPTETAAAEPAPAPAAEPAPARPKKETEAPEMRVEEDAENGEQVNPIAALAAEVERKARKLSLLELNERTCKWPIGDPSTDDFYFCGLPCAPDKPYCSAHVAMAYQPMSSRRDRDRNRNRASSA